MFSQHPTRLANCITIIYFLVAIAEVVSEMLQFSPGIIILKPLMPALLMLLYACTSVLKDKWYFLAMLLSVVTNLLFIPDNPTMLFYGVVAFMFHRLIVISLIFKLLKLADFIPVAIATVPFLLIFFYLLAISSEVPENSVLLLAVQNVLISIVGGFALSAYIMEDSKPNSLLLISGLLFVALQFMIFLEKYYLNNLSPVIFRPVAMALNALAFYAFYRFVIEAETSNGNRSANS